MAVLSICLPRPPPTVAQPLSDCFLGLVIDDRRKFSQCDLCLHSRRGWKVVLMFHACHGRALTSPHANFRHNLQGYTGVSEKNLRASRPIHRRRKISFNVRCAGSFKPAKNVHPSTLCRPWTNNSTSTDGQDSKSKRTGHAEDRTRNLFGVSETS